MEEFNLDLTLDEAAEARIAHAEFLNAVMDWGMKMGMLIQPFIHIANVLMQDEVSKDEIERISHVFPMGLNLLIDEGNELYDLLQLEATKVLGAPFAIHEGHSDKCDGTKDTCGHQSHWEA